MNDALSVNKNRLIPVLGTGSRHNLAVDNACSFAIPRRAGNKAVKSSFADRLLRVLDAERVAIVFVLFNFIMWARAWAATAVSNTTLDAIEI